MRAHFNDSTIRVYQAYSPEIARAAVAAGTFVPPFKRERMTWIKPSFTWMMYRSGWATKPGQERVLAIDILRTGFEQALAGSCLSHFKAAEHGTYDNWKKAMDESPVRIQWDPERTALLHQLPWRAIQIGISGETVDAYVDSWIVAIEDITPLVRELAPLSAAGNAEAILARIPEELPYPLPDHIAGRIGATRLRESSSEMAVRE